MYMMADSKYVKICHFLSGQWTGIIAWLRRPETMHPLQTLPMPQQVAWMGPEPEQVLHQADFETSQAIGAEVCAVGTV